MNRNVRQKKKLYPLPYHTYMSRSWQLIKRKSDLTVNTVLKHAYVRRYLQSFFIENEAAY